MDDVQQMLEALRGELLLHAAVRAVHFARQHHDEPEFGGYWHFRVSFRGRPGREWMLNDDEQRMDYHALEDWIRVIRGDVAMLCALDPEAEQFTSNARNAMALTEQHFRQLRQQLGLPWRKGRIPTTAHRKARELFIRTAGMDAYQVLNAGQGLPVRGSAGTPYMLHKKGSFCLTNLATDVRYCAVVPGVPLWDHLLGVKLMVEHDEPRLLAIANSSLGLGMYHAAVTR